MAQFRVNGLEFACLFHNESSSGELDTVSSSDDSLPHSFWAGVILSVIADVIIAISLNTQKIAHNRNADRQTGRPSKAFIRLPLWWVGITLNALGEVGNMLAYGLAPAAVVASVGSVGVVVNQIIAVCCLKEQGRKRDLGGVCGVVAGVVLIIFGVPETEKELTVQVMLSAEVFLAPRAYVYLSALVVVIAVLVIFVEPRYAERHILVWLTLCSVISSMTVVACRGFSSLVTQAASDCAAEHCVDDVLRPPCSQTLAHWFFWLLLVVIIVTAVWSAYYLNKAMQFFGNSETVPVYYCTFMLMSIVGGALVFNEFETVRGVQLAMFLSGVVLAILGVWLITSGRHSSPAAALSQSPSRRVSSFAREASGDSVTKPPPAAPASGDSDGTIAVAGEEKGSGSRPHSSADPSPPWTVRVDAAAPPPLTVPSSQSEDVLVANPIASLMGALSPGRKEPSSAGSSALSRARQQRLFSSSTQRALAEACDEGDEATVSV